LEAIGDLNEADPDLGLQVRVGVNTGEAVVAWRLLRPPARNFRPTADTTSRLDA
jgi:hypothetical protein